MPVVLELIVLMLIAYTAGFGIGWMIWGTTSSTDEGMPDDSKDGELP